MRCPIFWTLTTYQPIFKLTPSKYKTVELAEILDISRKTVSVKLKKLREKGIIERVGSDRKGYWNIYL